MRRFLLLAIAFSAIACLNVHGHQIGTTPITWNREVSRVIYNRCASCHRDGGSAFSLMTYREAQPRGNEIKEAVLFRRMPPWGAVKGFGDFRNDGGLTQEELELITDWVDGGMARGNNPNVLPPLPKFSKPTLFKVPKDAISVSGDWTLERPLSLDGLIPDKVPEGASLEVVAALPDGGIQPLVWLYEYKDSYQHPFWFRQSLHLPAGTIIRGVPPDAKIVLMPGKKSKGR